MSLARLRSDRRHGVVTTATASAVVAGGMLLTPVVLDQGSGRETLLMLGEAAVVNDSNGLTADRVGLVGPDHAVDTIDREFNGVTESVAGEAVLVAGVESQADRVRNARRVDPLAPLTSPDAGPRCAPGLDAAQLTAFFAEPIGRLQGADYQRAVRLPDDRVLWTFQDAFIDGILVHNAALVQSGRCFTLLDNRAGSWLFASMTVPLRRWHWILGGGTADGGSLIALFVVEMAETGSRYLERPRPVALRRVMLAAESLEVVRVVDEPIIDGDLYGWSMATDGDHTYLYSHCYRQFGYDTPLGFDPCVAEIRVARIAGDDFDSAREYWDGAAWSTDPERAVAVVDQTFVWSGNNPAQVMFDGARFLLVEKRDDWWGTTVEFGLAASATGPFTHLTTVPEPLACERAICNTYFASWLPWRDSAGHYTWAIGHNLWNGDDTAARLDRYRPTFHSIALPL